jgi:biotin-[acetyl-CoA-carboxylase] ligase BirA-like protein
VDKVSEISSGEEIAQKLRRLVCEGATVHYLPRVGSTNTWLKEQCADRRIMQQHLAFTNEQHSGRGTRGRDWQQQAGSDLAMSIATPLEAMTVLDMRLSLAVGAAVAGALEDVCGFPLRVKWPNDLLARPLGAAASAAWRKVGGILLERCRNGSPPSSALVVGVGVNVNSTVAAFAPELADRAITLRDLLRNPVDLAAVHIAVATSLLVFLKEALAPSDGQIEPLAPWLERWFARDVTPGTRYILDRDSMSLPVQAARVDRSTCGLWCVDEKGREHLVTSYSELRFPGETLPPA